MAKFTDPTGNGIIYISQTYHGEKTAAIDSQCAIDISMSGGEYFHSVCDGTVELVSSTGGYLSIIPDNLNARVLYVHTNGWLVSKGQRVTAGQKLGLISKTAPTHLHIGMKNKDNSANPPRIMDYFDRSLNFQTNYADIKAEWFKNGKLNWSLFGDLQYGTVSPSEDPRIAQMQKRIDELQSSNEKLSADSLLIASELAQQKREYEELNGRYNTLEVENGRLVMERLDAVEQLMNFKNSRFIWVVEILEKWFPKGS